MNEYFLHHLWKLRLFHMQHLETVSGEKIEIIKTGLHNSDAGPDFFNAQLKIGGTIWAGNVELHLKSSGWRSHSHDQDPAYDNVILHVVYEHDEEIQRKDGSLLPTLELKNKFDERLWKNYQDLLSSHEWIPCQHRFTLVDAFTFDNWLDRLLTERLERKTESICAALNANKNNWEETFYHHLARNFGFRLNAIPFEMLAKSLPLVCLTRHKNRLDQVEALLFGMAGMLEKNFADEYPCTLHREFEFMKIKFGFEPIQGHQWKFLRLRPLNFPTIRLAQFAQLVHRSAHLFSKIMECEHVTDIENFFRVEVSHYWQSHFTFDKPSAKRAHPIGTGAIQNIIINTIVPFLFAFGRQRNSEIHVQRALSFLEQLPAENNSIINGWIEMGIRPGTAYRSQALLQLKNEYCSEKKCLTCSIGNKIISNLP